MDRNSKTRTGARVPGVERQSARTEVLISASSRTQSREQRWQQRVRRMTANQFAGKASSAIPALKPYWGNSQYGILGEAMETSASFEARSAPLPYPTLDRRLSERVAYVFAGRPRVAAAARHFRWRWLGDR